MRILVVGAGGIGGYFGGRLAEAGSDVTFLLRERRAELVRANGVVIRSGYGDVRIASPQIVTAVDRPFDLILAACKAYDLDATMDAIAPGVRGSTTILPLLNGMRHLDALSARFGAARVLGGHCMISAALSADGAIEHFSELHHLTFGELDGSRTDRIAEIEGECARAKFTVNASSEILQEMWEKWVFIAAMGCINSLMRAATGDIVAAGATDLATGCYEEACAIGRRNGFAPRTQAVERALSILTMQGSAITASLLKDVEAGRRTEADHIIGDLISRGGDLVQPRSLLRIGYAHLTAHEMRRLREQT
jgi:2-dehydropantoate 2-reductase